MNLRDLWRRKEEKWQTRIGKQDGTITLVTPIPHTQNHILIHILFSYLIAIIGRRNKSAVQQFRLYQKIYEKLGKPLLTVLNIMSLDKGLFRIIQVK
jgi:hypothetical protein